VTSCELFPKFGLQGSLKVWQTFYCEGDYERCARYRLARIGGHPAPNLLPNGKELDLTVLGAAR
jgi:hypothetical protein